MPHNVLFFPGYISAQTRTFEIERSSFFVRCSMRSVWYKNGDIQVDAASGSRRGQKRRTKEKRANQNPICSYFFVDVPWAFAHEPKRKTLTATVLPQNSQHTPYNMDIREGVHPNRTPVTQSGPQDDTCTVGSG